MSRQMRWIYRDMMDMYYDTEKPLPLDLELLYDSIGVESEDDRKLVERILRFKFEKTEGGYVNGVCDKTICEYHAKADIAKANGKLGGRPSKAKQNPKEPSGFLSGSDVVPIGNPDQTISEANQEPLTNNQEPITNTKDTVAGFSDDLDLGEVVMPMNDAERELGVHLALVKPKPVKAKSAEFFEIPDWINRAHWDAWHSCAKRKKATPEQKQMAVDKLDQWRREGVDFAAALESAALAGWQGLFKPDDRKTTATSINRNTHKYAGAAAAIWGNDAPLDERTINV